MQSLPAGSVAVVVTSPPYNIGKAYGAHNDAMPEAEYLEWQGDVAREIARVLKPDGHLFLNVGSNTKHPWRDMDVAMQYRKHLVMQNRFAWVKSIALNAESLKGPSRQEMHERTFGHFASINSEHFVNPCWEPVYHFSPSGRSPIDRLAIGVRYACPDQPARFGHNRDRHCRGSVWHIPYATTQSRDDKDNHPATFPVALASMCLKLAAPKDGLVLDPFSGTGSTLVAAAGLGLNAVGIDIDPTYCDAARRRVAALQPAQRDLLAAD